MLQVCTDAYFALKHYGLHNTGAAHGDSYACVRTCPLVAAPVLRYNVSTRVVCVCVLVCAPFPCHAPFYRTLHTPSSMHPYHPPTHRSSPPIPTPPIPTPPSPPLTHPFYCTLHTPFRHAPLPHPPTATFTLQQQFILIVGHGAGDKCLAASNAF